MNIWLSFTFSVFTSHLNPSDVAWLHHIIIIIQNSHVQTYKHLHHFLSRWFELVSTVETPLMLIQWVHMCPVEIPRRIQVSLTLSSPLTSASKVRWSKSARLKVICLQRCHTLDAGRKINRIISQQSPKESVMIYTAISNNMFCLFLTYIWFLTPLFK